MIYTFWRVPVGLCIIEIGSTGEVYVTDWIDWYNTKEGRNSLLPHTKEWGTDKLSDYNLNECFYLGQIEVPDNKMSESDTSILQRCIDKEGFDYAMLYYSDYKSVDYNDVKDLGFHQRLYELKKAHEDLKLYLKMKGIRGI